MTDNVKQASNVVDIFADFAVNDDAVYVPYKGDVEFLIARANNKQFRKEISRQYKKHERLLESKTEAADEKGEEIMVEVMAKTILVGWKGALAVKGEVLTYSVENAKKLLSVPLFREWVSKQADDVNSYKVVKEAEEEKN